MSDEAECPESSHYWRQSGGRSAINHLCLNHQSCLLVTLRKRKSEYYFLFESYLQWHLNDIINATFTLIETHKKFCENTDDFERQKVWWLSCYNYYKYYKNTGKVLRLSHVINVLCYSWKFTRSFSGKSKPAKQTRGFHWMKVVAHSRSAGCCLESYNYLFHCWAWLISHPADCTEIFQTNHVSCMYLI